MPLLVSVVPGTIPQALDPLCCGPFALPILQDPGQQTLPCSAQLHIMFHLMPAETRPLDVLSDNETIESYALKAGVSRNTVRTHLASLLTKTGTKRQA